MPNICEVLQGVMPFIKASCYLMCKKIILTQFQNAIIGDSPHISSFMHSFLFLLKVVVIMALIKQRVHSFVILAVHNRTDDLDGAFQMGLL